MAQPRKLHDRFFKQAKAEGYAARSAYKLIQINERKRLISKADRVLDLGCAPGSWLQVAADLVGPGGVVAGIDLKPVTAQVPPNARAVVADVFRISPETLAGLIGGSPALFDVILSDMAPNTEGGGGGAGDHFRSVELCRRVLELVPRLLKPGGHLVMKVFEGEVYGDLIAETRALFTDVKGFKPEASRDVSREMYIIARESRQAGVGTAAPSPAASAPRPRPGWGEPREYTPGGDRRAPRSEGRRVTFLAPTAGLIGAAIAVPILVGLYLLKLRRRPLRVSTTLLWEQAAQDLQANVPLRWVRPSWLLVLQTLALACVLAAIARPAIRGAGAAGATRIVLLIDRSASMSAADGDPTGPRGRRPGSHDPPITRLDAAKQGALEIIDATRRSSGGPDHPGNPRRPDVMIIAYAAEARVLAGFTSNTTDLREAVRAVQPSDQPDDLPLALSLLRSMDAGVVDESDRRETTRVVILTDSPIDLARVAGELPAGASVNAVRVGPEQADGAPALYDNLGIVALGAMRESERPSTVRVFVRVINAGPEDVKTAVSCRIDDRPAGIAALDLPPALALPGGSMEPGSASASFSIDHPGGGFLSVSIPRPDLLASDNQAALVLAPASKARVLVVGPGDESGDPLHAARGIYGIDRFLLSLLENMDLGSLESIDAGTYQARFASDRGDRAGADAWGAGHDLIIFDRTEPRSLPAVPTISIGAGLPALGVRVEPVREGEPGGEPTRVAIWSRTHPILRYAPLDALLISPPMRIVLPEPSRSPGVGESFSPLVQGSAGPLMVAIDNNATTPADAAGRRVPRLVIGFDLLRTNWGPDVSFPVFVASAVEHLTGRGDAAAGRAFTTVQNVGVAPRPGAARIRVVGPLAFDVPVPPAPPAGEGTGFASPPVPLGVLEAAGVYRAGGAREADEVIAVNMLSEQESLLSAGPSAGSAGGGGPGAQSPSGPSLQDLRPTDYPRREIWHWFIAAAGVLSSIEWIVYALRARS